MPTSTGPVLVAELTAAHPEKKSAYEKLLPAAAELHARRRQHLSDDNMQTLTTEFDTADSIATCGEGADTCGGASSSSSFGEMSGTMFSPSDGPPTRASSGVAFDDSRGASLGWRR